MNYTVYTDGSCKPKNPGYCGCGIVFVLDDKVVHTDSVYLGEGTNNIAELTAVKLSLEYIKEQGLEWNDHVIYTDSNYVVGMLTKNWKPSKNTELIVGLRKMLEYFPNTNIEWIKGHNQHTYNDMADELANRSVDNGMP